MINLLWGAQRLFEAALAVPVGIAAMVIGQIGNEWMKSAAAKEPVATKQTAPAKKAAAPAKKPAAPAKKAAAPAKKPAAPAKKAAAPAKKPAAPAKKAAAPAKKPATAEKPATPVNTPVIEKPTNNEKPIG